MFSTLGVPEFDKGVRVFAPDGSEARRAYIRKYRSRPEVAAKIAAYHRRPEVRARANELKRARRAAARASR